MVLEGECSFGAKVSNMRLKEWLTTKGCKDSLYDDIKSHMEDYAVDDLIALGKTMKKDYGIRAKVNFDDKNTHSFTNGILEFVIDIDDDHFFMLSATMTMLLYTKANTAIPIDVVEVSTTKRLDGTYYNIEIYDLNTRCKLYTFSSKITLEMIDQLMNRLKGDVEFDDHMIVDPGETGEGDVYIIKPKKDTLPRVEVKIDESIRKMIGTKLAQKMNLNQ